MVNSITVRSSQKSVVKYTRMSPAINHDVTNLSDDDISRVFMNASIRKYRILYPSMVHRVITLNVTI